MSVAVVKFDFSKPLETEIDKLKAEKELIEKEIEIRKERTAMTALESVQNDRAILELLKSIPSKDSYLEELERRALLDKAELDEDYVEVSNNYQEYFDKVEKVEDKHQLAQLTYLAKQLELFLEEENKEAVVFFFRGIKQSLKEAGIE